MLLLLRFALTWVGVYLGLVVKGPEAVTGAQILVWPLGFLSNAFVAPATMPGCSLGYLSAVSELRRASRHRAAQDRLAVRHG